jgi:formylglycine-generating enzyme required for sulfatase activity
MRLGSTGRIWPLLKHSPDPTARSYFLQRLAPLGAKAEALVSRLERESDVSIRRALILSLGEFSTDALPLSQRETLTPKLLKMYSEDPDPGIHGAAEWLLWQWGQQDQLHDLHQTLATGECLGDRLWYVTSQGQTMVVVRGPGEFFVGSPEGEENRGSNERLHRRRIDRSFAISTKEVTVAEFERFDPDSLLLRQPDFRDCHPEPGCPMSTVTWYGAAAYCNWLSDQEGIPEDQWCYQPNESDEFAEGMKPAPDFRDRTGYRLPTESEWEFACRAGAVTSRHFGNTERLLDRYAWYLGNSKQRTWPAGLMRPNDLGLFDMHGNVWNWCQDRYRSYPDSLIRVNDPVDQEPVTDAHGRVLRGGSFLNLSLFVRAATRVQNRPSLLADSYGFRPARTCP